MPSCPLCEAGNCTLFHEDSKRTYLQCDNCGLVHVPREYHLSPAQEKTEYDQHENSLDDPGYRRFLTRLADPLTKRLSPESKGMDFGCGPGPALAAMLREHGHQVALYDPFYFPDKDALQGPYDFITATEVLEHLARPGQELQQLWQALAVGGTLGIMTKLVLDKQRFATWHYIRDPTHICFYSRDTFHWLANRLDATLMFSGKDAILLQKH